MGHYGWEVLISEKSGVVVAGPSGAEDTCCGMEGFTRRPSHSTSVTIVCSPSLCLLAGV